VADHRQRGPRLPPRWFIRLAWSTHRAIYRVTGGRLGLWRPKPGRWGTLRLTTTGRRTGRPHSVIVGYFEDGPNLVTLAMNGWADPEPAWWRNLQAQPEATVELVGATRAVRARAAQGSGAVAPVGPLVRDRPATGRLCGDAVVTDGGGGPGSASGIALIGRARPPTSRHEEPTGTPRLSTLTPVGKHGLEEAAAWQDRDQLTVWCEHADQPHPGRLGITLGSSYG
jgi:deazaflavin-dependent oxidoreductase (nitroreductase family)